MYLFPAATVLFAAVAAIGTADALASALLCLIDISGRRTENHDQNDNNNYSFHITFSRSEHIPL